MTWEAQPPPTVVVESDAEPTGVPGLLWIDTSDPDRPAFLRWDTTEEEWVLVGGASVIHYAEDPPDDPRQGDVFIDRATIGFVQPDGSRA